MVNFSKKNAPRTRRFEGAHYPDATHEKMSTPIRSRKEGAGRRLHRSQLFGRRIARTHRDDPEQQECQEHHGNGFRIKDPAKQSPALNDQLPESSRKARSGKELQSDPRETDQHGARIEEAPPSLAVKKNETRQRNRPTHSNLRIDSIARTVCLIGNPEQRTVTGADVYNSKYVI